MPFFSLSSPSSGNATQLQGRAVSATAPATGSILAWSGSTWAPGSGVTGPTGARGDDGARIWSGTGAPAAGFGASGDFWVDTVNGRLYGPKADGSWGTPLQLQSGPAGPQGVTGPMSTVPGPTGATGAASTVPGPTGPASTVTGPTGSRGATLLAGDGAPLSNYGSDGDWYIDTVAADFYGPKAGGSWGTPAIKLPDSNATVVALGNSGTTRTLSLAGGSSQTVTLTANCVFTLPAASGAATLTLFITQSGAFTATFPGVLWPGGTAPTITATANKRDVLSFQSDGANWYGSARQNF